MIERKPTHKTFKPRHEYKGFQRPSFAEALAALQAKRETNETVPRIGPVRSQKRIGAGRRTKDWRAAWRFLKPRLKAAGRTYCEFDFIIHECAGPLDPAHSKKRHEMEGDDIFAVAIACRKVHRILDEKLNHEQMEVAVMHAIERHGGMVTPKTEATKKALAIRDGLRRELEALQGARKAAA